MSLIDQTSLRPHATMIKESVMDVPKLFFPLSTEAKIVLAILLVVALWGLAIFTFGVPALVWPMKLIVPALIVSLVLLTWGM